MDVHKVAADFLIELERGNSFYQEEQIEVEPLATFAGLVALRRPVKPHYFYGFKPSGRPIFTHDLRLAKSFETAHHTLTQHIEHLAVIGEKVEPHPTVWSEGKHYNQTQL